jgi:hypothetical protein
MWGYTMQTILRLIRRHTFRNTGERVSNHELILTKIIEYIDEQDDRIERLEHRVALLLRREASNDSEGT